MNGWGRIGAMGGSLLLAMTLTACGATPSGASPANPSGGHRVAGPAAKPFVARLRYGPIPWPSQLKADKTDPQGYVVTSKAQIKKLPKPVAAAVRTALKTESQYVATAWLGGMLSGAGTAKKVPPIPPAHVIASRWVTVDLVAGFAKAYGGPGAGCKNIANLKTTGQGIAFDYDMRAFLCNGTDPSNGDGYFDNPWNAMKFSHVTQFAGPGHPGMPVVVVATTPDKAGEIFVPFGARGDFRFVASPGPGQSGPTRYGALSVEGWSSLIVTPIAGQGWRIATPVLWLWPATAHRAPKLRKAGWAAHMWYAVGGCKSAPKAAPRYPARLPDPMSPKEYTQLAVHKLKVCGPGGTSG